MRRSPGRARALTPFCAMARPPPPPDLFALFRRQCALARACVVARVLARHAELLPFARALHFPRAGPAAGELAGLLREKHDAARTHTFVCRGTDRCSGCRHPVVKPAAIRTATSRARIQTAGAGEGAPYVLAKWRPKEPYWHSVDWPCLSFMLADPAEPADFKEPWRLRTRQGESGEQLLTEEFFVTPRRMADHGQADDGQHLLVTYAVKSVAPQQWPRVR